MSWLHDTAIQAWRGPPVSVEEFPHRTGLRVDEAAKAKLREAVGHRAPPLPPRHRLPRQHGFKQVHVRVGPERPVHGRFAEASGRVGEAAFNGAQKHQGL